MSDNNQKTQSWKIREILPIIGFLFVIGILVVVVVWNFSQPKEPETCKEYEELNPKTNSCNVITIEYIKYKPTGITREETRVYQGVIREMGILQNFIVLTNGLKFFVEPNGMYHDAEPGDFITIKQVKDYATSCSIEKIWLSNKTKFESSNYTQEDLFKITKIFPTQFTIIKPTGILSTSDTNLCGESSQKYIIWEITK